MFCVGYHSLTEDNDFFSGHGMKFVQLQKEFRGVSLSLSLFALEMK